MSDTLEIDKPAAAVVRARVKWFNHGKGFGFVAPLDGAADAFLHASVLAASGFSHLPEGADVLCEVTDGEKGPQVARLLEVAMPAGSEAQEMVGTVKWFSPEKGFGFVVAEGGGSDVFVHKSVLKRAGMEVLEERQQVRLRVTATPKGREAIWIAPE